MIIKTTDDFDIWKWSKKAFGTTGYLLGWTGLKKNITKRFNVIIKNVKNLYMLIETLKMLFTRDLNHLKSEIILYKNESDIWKIQEGIASSAWNLCLHLVGNLNTYSGAEFGKTGYTRNRPVEFPLKIFQEKNCNQKSKQP